jgi:hypothetical protein
MISIRGNSALPKQESATCLEINSVTGFSARHPHVSSGAGWFPEDIPEEKRRTESLYVPQLLGEEYVQNQVRIISHPRLDVLKCEDRKVNPSFYIELATVKSASRERWMERKMLKYIRTNILNFAMKRPQEMIRFHRKWSKCSSGRLKPRINGSRLAVKKCQSQRIPEAQGTANEDMMPLGRTTKKLAIPQLYVDSISLTKRHVVGRPSTNQDMCK